MNLYRRSVAVFGAVSVLLGVAIFAETVTVHGGSVGYVLGVLFVGLGLGRLYLMRRR